MDTIHWLINNVPTLASQAVVWVLTILGGVYGLASLVAASLPECRAKEVAQAIALDVGRVRDALTGLKPVQSSDPPTVPTPLSRSPSGGAQ